jgi:prepilin-type N-terminal cleavage/methylation domain-containing protein
MKRPLPFHGFSLIETLVALVLVGMSMTSLVVAFVASSKFGVLSRRQATALAVARSIAGDLTRVAYSDARLANANVGNDATIADPNGLYAWPTLPTGSDAPDTSLGARTVGNESYDAYVNVAVATDPDVAGREIGRTFAVIVRYRVGGSATNPNSAKWMRAVAIGYHYNPAAVGTGTIPLPL